MIVLIQCKPRRTSGMSVSLPSPGGNMQGKSRWLLYLIVGWVAAKTTLSAFSAPWSWTLDQCLFVFLVLCAVFVLAQWVLTWQRGGMAAVKERWAFNRQQRSAPLDKKIYYWSLLFWVAVAVALILVFNLVQR